MSDADNDHGQPLVEHLIELRSRLLYLCCRFDYLPLTSLTKLLFISEP